MYGDDIDIDSNKLSHDFSFFGKQDFNFSGNVKNLELKVNLHDIKNNFYVVGNFTKCIISYKKNHILNFSGSVKSNLDALSIDFNSLIQH